jgi:hypothetical protein
VRGRAGARDRRQRGRFRRMMFLSKKTKTEEKNKL